MYRDRARIFMENKIFSGKQKTRECLEGLFGRNRTLVLPMLSYGCKVFHIIQLLIKNKK